MVSSINRSLLTEWSIAYDEKFKRIMNENQNYPRIKKPTVLRVGFGATVV